MQCLQYKPVSYHFLSRGGECNPLVEVPVNRRRKTLKTFVPITSRNSDSGLDTDRREIIYCKRAILSLSSSKY
jgi:hypothetical protein